MSEAKRPPAAGEELIKQDLITREDLDQAQAHEKESGTPWYKQLIQMRKVSFESVENVLRYEFHPKSKRAEHQTLGQRLVDEGHLKAAQLKTALADQKRNGRLLGNILLEKGLVTREAIAQTLSKQHGIEFTLLNKAPSEPQALESVPESIAQKNAMLPVTLEGDRLTVLIHSPQNLEPLKDVSVLLGKRIHAVLTTTDDFKAEIEKRYAALKKGATSRKSSPEKPQSTSDATPKSPRTKRLNKPLQQEQAMAQQSAHDLPEETSEQEKARFHEIAKEASGVSVVKMVSTILEGAVNSGATDIHLDPQDPEVRVRYRIDGILHDVMSIPEAMAPAVVSRIKIISELDITETRHPQDGHISLEINDREFDIRVATLPTFLGERVVLRLLDQSSVLSGVRDLGLENEDEKKMLRIIDQPYGMVLVTGPTGSGKTTSLYAALNQKNVMTDSIVTLEDPVEYQLSGINQVQIDTDIDLTFASTLRASLRQDIDVLLVGEIRDSETARIAIRAAMTGHLVFSTLHTNDATEAIDTLRNMDIPSYLIASALTAVIAQRLVRTICENCKKSFPPTPALLKSIGLTSTTKKLYRGKGCEACYHTGNRGRTGIFEVLEISASIRKLIGEEVSSLEIAKKAKLKSMGLRCRQKVKRGDVNPEEYLRVIRT